MDVHPIILCGGPGSRLWPASVAASPKPFIKLVGESSLFQQTVLRMAGVPGAVAPVIIAGLDHVEVVRAQLAQIGVEGVIIAEPAARDTGPALLAATAFIAARSPRAVAVAVASDHYVPDHAAFQAKVEETLTAAAAGDIVTFGVTPTAPATGYGYIQPAKEAGADAAVRRVARFIEKPDAARAVEFVRAGYLWNSGNFVFRVDVLLAEAERLAPAVVEPVLRAVAGAAVEAGVVRLGPEFAAAEKRAIDVAVMERTDRAAVLEIGYAWSDLGAWDAVWAASEKDEHGNVATPAAVVLDSSNCLIRADTGCEVIALGLTDIAVIVHAGKVLVCDLGSAQKLKTALERLPPARA